MVDGTGITSIFWIFFTKDFPPHHVLFGVLQSSTRIQIGDQNHADLRWSLKTAGPARFTESMSDVTDHGDVDGFTRERSFMTTRGAVELGGGAKI